MTYDSTDKQKIYWLINEFLSKKIDIMTFVNQLHECYGLEVDRTTLDEQEKKALKSLSNITNRFSPYEQDLEKYSDVYFTEEQVHQKILETREQLRNTAWGKIFFK